MYGWLLEVLVPDAKEAVPGASGDGHSILGHAQAGHPVVMSSQDTLMMKKKNQGCNKGDTKYVHL